MPDDDAALAGAPVALATTATPRRRARGPRAGSDAAGASSGSPRVIALQILGGLALAALVIATLGIVVTAAHGPSILVPRSGIVFPHWDAGPLRALFDPPFNGPATLARALSITLGAMFIAYAALLVAARHLSMWVIGGVIVLLHVILLLGPPLQLNDVFNYLGYARLGALHGLNPYTHVISDESLDPVFRFASWDGLRSPYGELFTIVSYPLAFLGLSVAFWIVKAVTVLLSLAFLWLVWLCARQLGRDPRLVVAFVALNPIYIFYAVGGFHNDFLMLVPSTAAILWALRGHDRSAGAALVVAVAVKFTAILLGPFLLIALATRRRCLQLIVGGLLALVPLLAASLALFGTALPNVAQQSTLLTDFSVPNLAGLPFGVGGSPFVLHLATFAVVLVAAHQLLRRRSDWLAGAGWVTVALILSLSWAVPWYVIWLLPLAGLSRRRGLRAATLALTVFMLFAFVPVTTNYINNHRVLLLDTPAGRASRSLQYRLAN